MNKALVARVNQLKEMVKEADLFLNPPARIESNLREVLRKGKESCLQEIRELEQDIEFNCKVLQADPPRKVIIGGIDRLVLDGWL